MVKSINDKHIHEGGRLDLSKLMPADASSVNVLNIRAKTLAMVEKGVENEGQVSANYIRFQCGQKEYYGIAYEDILDISKNEHITKMPLSPSFVLGICYWHGKLISVIDLGRYLGLSHDGEIGGTTFVTTISHDKFVIGISFDDVMGVDTYLENSLDPGLAVNSKIKESYVRGIHAGKTTILNIHNILADIVNELTKEKGK